MGAGGGRAVAMSFADLFSLQALVGPVGLLVGYLLGVFPQMTSRHARVGTALVALGFGGVLWINGAREAAKSNQKDLDDQTARNTMNAKLDQQGRLLIQALGIAGDRTAGLKQRTFRASANLFTVARLVKRHESYGHRRQGGEAFDPERWHRDTDRIIAHGMRAKDKCLKLGGALTDLIHDLPPTAKEVIEAGFVMQPSGICTNRLTMEDGAQQLAAAALRLP